MSGVLYSLTVDNSFWRCWLGFSTATLTSQNKVACVYCRVKSTGLFAPLLNYFLNRAAQSGKYFSICQAEGSRGEVFVKATDLDIRKNSGSEVTQISLLQVTDIQSIWNAAFPSGNTNEELSDNPNNNDLSGVVLGDNQFEAIAQDSQNRSDECNESKRDERQDESYVNSRAKTTDIFDRILTTQSEITFQDNELGPSLQIDGFAVQLTKERELGKGAAGVVHQYTVIPQDSYSISKDIEIESSHVNSLAVKFFEGKSVKTLTDYLDPLSGTYLKDEKNRDKVQTTLKDIQFQNKEEGAIYDHIRRNMEDGSWPRGVQQARMVTFSNSQGSKSSVLFGPVYGGDGRSLNLERGRNGAVDIKVCLQESLDVIRGIDWLRNKGVILLDIKSENTLLVKNPKEGEAKMVVADFGGAIYMNRMGWKIPFFSCTPSLFLEQELKLLKNFHREEQQDSSNPNSTRIPTLNRMAEKAQVFLKAGLIYEAIFTTEIAREEMPKLPASFIEKNGYELFKIKIKSALKDHLGLAELLCSMFDPDPNKRPKSDRIINNLEYQIRALNR